MASRGYGNTSYHPTRQQLIAELKGKLLRNYHLYKDAELDAMTFAELRKVRQLAVAAWQRYEFGGCL